MNKNVKRTVLAMMVAGMTVSGAAGVYAGSNLQKISAYLNQTISFKIDGKAFTPTDANGNKLAPIVYQDTTYLPVRALSEALNAPVFYDSKTGVITISTPSNGSGSGPIATDEWVMPNFTAAQLDAIKKAFAGFDGFETAYAPQLMLKGDTFKNAMATGDGVNLVFDNMTVNVSPRDYSIGYDSKPVTLSSGVKAKWYTPSATPMLTFQLDDRYVTISSPANKLSQAQMEKVAASVAKLGGSQAVTDLAAVSYTASQVQAIKEEFAKFDGFTAPYAPTQMAKGDSLQKVVGGDDSVSFLFNHMRVDISPRDNSFEYDGKEVTLSNGVKAKWYTPSDTAMLTVKLDDRFVTLSSPDHSLSNALLEKAAAAVAKLK